jgi:hypothetical protein
MSLEVNRKSTARQILFLMKKTKKREAPKIGPIYDSLYFSSKSFCFVRDNVGGAPPFVGQFIYLIVIDTIGVQLSDFVVFHDVDALLRSTSSQSAE